MEPNQLPTQPIPEPQNLASQGDALQNQSVSGTKKSLSKWPLVIVGIILILVLIGGAFMLGKNMNVNQKPTSKTQTTTPTPTPDPTATWKTYTKDFLNQTFSIKYPDNFYLETTLRGGVDYIGDSKTSIEDTFLSGKPPQKNQILVSLFFMETNIDNLQKIANSLYGTPQTNVAYTPIAVAGYPAVMKIVNNNIETYGILANGRSFQISAQPINSTQIQTFHTMLSTIKFTDQTSQTTNWKTYASTCGFTVKLPQDWNAAAYIVSGTENSCGRITDPNFKTYPNSDKRDGFDIFFDRKKIGSMYMNTQINDIESYLLSQERVTTPQATINNRDDKMIGKFSGTEYDSVGMGGERQFVFVNNGYIYTASWPLELTIANRAIIDKIINSISFN